jgi:hypothetical protein
MQSMMGCFMPYYKKTKHVFLRLIFMLGMLLTLHSAQAGNPSNIHIKSAELTLVEDAYVLNSEFDISLSPFIEDALNKGIPLTFLVEFQLSTPRKYWFDDEVVSQSHHLTLSYHALSRQYLINRSGRQQSYSSLQKAKEDLSKIKDWAVLDKRVLKKGEAYQAALRVRLDQSKLPKPLQVEAAGSEDWSILSERYRWIPSFNLLG